jgi:carbonic anhydrase
VDLPKAGEKSKKPVALATDYHQLPLEILNNGHTVQVPATAGGKIAWEGTDYQLQQFHFHTPSEHSIAGVKFDGELHLVHKNANGELLVLGLLLKSGKENKLLEPVIAAAPEQESHELKAVTGVKVDLSGLVPVKVPYYAYPGSLTTPPCSEGVKWLVVAKPLEISSTQLKKMQSALHGENARPTLPLGARTVVEVHP